VALKMENFRTRWGVGPPAHRQWFYVEIDDLGLRKQPIILGCGILRYGGGSGVPNPRFFPGKIRRAWLSWCFALRTLVLHRRKDGRVRHLLAPPTALWCVPGSFAKAPAIGWPITRVMLSR